MGPACEEEDIIKKLILEGAAVCRLNMAHADHDWTRKIIRRIRKVCEEIRIHIPIMMDIKGPEIRTGPIEGGWELEKGEIIHFVTNESLLNDQPEGVRSITVNYPDIVRDVKVGTTMLVDSGLIHLEVLEVTETLIRAKVLIPGELRSRRHINLPGVHVNLPALTEKDKKDILVGIEEDIVYFALSFVRQSSDIDELRDFLHERKSSAKIIAKIEDQSGVANLNSIIKASDGVMVARGDLGIEWPFDELPIIQTQIVDACIAQSKPVIVATHMLESMIQAPIPTRAEVSDIATAIYEKADAIMLSGETSVGKYPVECVQTMRRIANSIEKSSELGHKINIKLETHKAKMLRSAILLARELDNAPIMVFTTKGRLAYILSSLRPSLCPIYAFTNSHITHKQMKLLWGIDPFLIEFNKNPEDSIKLAFEKLLERSLITPDEWVVAITNAQSEHVTFDSIQIRKANT